MKTKVKGINAGKAQRTRRRFARRQWARRWLVWRYVVAAVLALALIGFGVYAVYFSPWLRVDGVSVVGVDQLTETEVVAAAAVPTGGPLARADLDAIERRVLALTTVREVDVSRHWPDRVRIEIVERSPIAVVDRGDTITYLDADGVTFGKVEKPPADLPLVEVGPGADAAALEEAGEVVDSLDADIRARVHHVEVETVDQIRLELRDGRMVRWGSADQSEEKADVLLVLLAENKNAQVYDVSVPAMPTVCADGEQCRA